MEELLLFNFVFLTTACLECASYVSALAGVCSRQHVQGINTVIPLQLQVPTFTVQNVGCRSGFKLAPMSSVRNVTCLPNGTWTEFPVCDGK